MFETVIVAVNRAGLVLRKHSPEILMGLGFVSFVGTVVLASKAALKSEEIVAEYKNRMDIVNKAEEHVEKGEVHMPEDYDPRKEKAAVAAVAVKDLAIAYAPTVAVGATSLTCFFVAHKILSNRYLATAAALTSVTEAFDAYRKRVREEAGEEMDKHYRYGTAISKVVETVTDEAGNETTVEATKEETNYIPGPSEYARIFDEENPNWDPNPTFNLMFLRAQQEYANNLFKSRGHLFLNEVYDLLDFPRTPVGAVAGWVKGEGDDYIDFGLYDETNKDVIRFINGKSANVLLDFNVSGRIWDKI